MASPTTAAAGTAHTSLRSIAAGDSVMVCKSIERSGFINVEIGFIQAVTRTSSPLVTPPSRPPALLVGRMMPGSVPEPIAAPGRISSWTREPGRSPTLAPSPMPDGLDGLNRHHGLRDSAVELAVPLDVTAEAGWHAMRDDLEGASHCVAGLTGLIHSAPHRMPPPSHQHIAHRHRRQGL
jgi:hypothetical protein